MKPQTIVWLIIMLAGLIGLVANTMLRGAGKVYVQDKTDTFYNVGTEEEPNWIRADSTDVFDYDLDNVSDDQRVSWDTSTIVSETKYEENATDPAYRFSFWQTLGLWVSAFFTLAIFSFLYKDNPLYKIAEACVIGISAAWWMVAGFWDTIVPNLIGKLFPDMVQQSMLPGVSGEPELLYLIPLGLSILLLMRLSPKGAWLSRWPMAFIIGVFCGLRLIGFLSADFLAQIRPGIDSLYVANDVGQFLFWEFFNRLVLLIGVLSTLTYFFFSIEHKGVVGATARVGIWFLMVTFGAAFGFTVMGRIALLAIRLEFLFGDWLKLI